MRDDDPWSGQVALPGGMRKRGETLQETATRETKEEVGIMITPKGYIGSFRTHARDIVVAAFYSSVQEEPRFSIDDEVDEVYWARINSLTPTITDAGFPGYKFYGGVVWGLTYRILSECLQEVH
ncbi:NUDIX hydrolase [mine drainage metagenome]|uniref:NUDIX hydrolase n=1 Tax=mine drainage metagenome TaxID=410659 RepID=T1AVQ6_9ZZZZ